MKAKWECHNYCARHTRQLVQNIWRGRCTNKWLPWGGKKFLGIRLKKLFAKLFLFLGFREWCEVVPLFYVFSVAEINLYSDNFTKTLHKFLMNIQGNNQRNSLFNFWRWSHKDKVDDVGKISSVTNSIGGFGFCRFSLPRKPDSTRHSQDEDGLAMTMIITSS